MSYLVMPKAPLPDANKMIISLWFRDITRKEQTTNPDGSKTKAPTQAPVDPPKIKQWPQGFWGAGTPAANMNTMVPPNSQYSLSYDPEFMDANAVFFFNPYGLPAGGAILDGLFMGPAAVNIPCAPPVISNTWSTAGGAGGGAIGGIADVDMSPSGIRTLLTFGDPGISYNYSTWTSWHPSVIDFVDYTLLSLLSGSGIVFGITPPPYKPHPEGGKNKGLFPVYSWKLSGTRNAGNVAQSFIGIDNAGSIIINLQTNTKANYKGWAFEQNNVTELWASQTHLEIMGPPYSYTQLGFPFPDGYWVSVDGYWDGYEFEYRDISQEVMGCAPESFAIVAKWTGLFDFVFGAPTIQDGGWHHLLLSFDLSGSVELSVPSVTGGTEIVPTYSAGPLEVAAADPKAWLALDNSNYSGSNLQVSCGVHDGWRLPKLRGTQTTQILDCGPTGGYNRGGAPTDNWILPRNAWLFCWGGNPKDGLIGNGGLPNIVDNTNENPGYRCSSNMDLDNCFGVENGDYDAMTWTGAIWPLYGGCNAVAPGPWHGENHPKKPSRPEPGALFEGQHYQGSGFTIPIHGHPIGIPCASGSGPTAMGALGPAFNTGFEVAELQIWVGKSIDTSKEDNRRLFVDYPKQVDKDGNVSRDTSKGLRPVSPATAEKMLGKPDILIHGTHNWKHGRNTGTSGFIFQGGKKFVNPEGQFMPVAKIEKFKPDPILGQ